MGKYKEEGHSTVFNLGIQSVVRRKQTKDGRILEVVSLSPSLKAILYLKGDQLVCAKTFLIPKDSLAKRKQELIILHEYNLYKRLLVCNKLISFEAVDLLSPDRIKI